MNRPAVETPLTTRRVVELACRAPSVHNTQPWAWRIGPDRIELYADWSRQLPASDPDPIVVQLVEHLRSSPW